MPLVLDVADPAGTGDLASHYLPLEQAARAYEILQRKEEGCTTVLLPPGRTEPEVFPGVGGALAR